MERNNPTAAAVLAAGLVVWAALVARFWFVADDAYITFRYSRNWALGRGILYNVGEPPVEGYSNFLWMAIAAVVERLGLPVQVVMPALSVVLAAVLLGWVFGTLVRHLGVPPVVAAVGTAVLATSPVFGLWSTSGLETMPFALLLFVTFERLVLARKVVGAIVAGVLLCLVRTEGPAWVVVIAVLAGFAAWMDRRSVRDVAVFLGVVVVAYVPYFAWRYHHFGTWVSNTTLAKVGFGAYAVSQGAQYLVSFWLAMIAPALLLLAVPIARRRPSIGVPIVLMAVAFPVYAVVVGGDYMPMGRLLLPGLPFAVLLATWAAAARRPVGMAVLVAVAGIGVLPAFDVNPVPRQIREVFHYRDNQRKMRSEYVQWASLREHTTRWIRLGTAMRQVAEPGDRWVTGGIGALGYYSDVFLYDVGGLVSREVALRPWNDREEKSRSPGHEKTVPNTFFLDREPEFMRAELVEGDDWAQAIPKEVDRWKVSAEVRALYVPDFREVAPIGGVRQFAVFLRRAGDDEDPAMVWAQLQARVRDHRRTGGPAGMDEDREQDEIAALEAIGYVDGDVPALGRAVGVVTHEPGVAPGLNFLVSGHGPEAVLLDPDGKALYTWRKAFHDVWPDNPTPSGERGTRFWRAARLRGDGSVVAVFEGYGIFAVDRHGGLLWENANHAHHDLALLPDGDLWTLTREAHVPAGGGRAVLEDAVSLLGPDGVEKRRISVLNALRESPWRSLVEGGRRKAGDLMHTNAVEVLDDRLAAHGPAFRPGNLLLSMRVIDTLAVLDVDTERIVWAQKGPYVHQHDPHVVDGGRILVFDNVGAGGHSRLVEIDPTTGEIGWEYRDSAATPFYSRTCGIATRLANGNTLVSETMIGRAFELTPDGKIVWDYLSPYRVGSDDSIIARVFELHRVPAPDWLD